MQDLSMDLKRVALKRRRTKIVATVGPASSSPDVLRSLIDAGVDVFRLNFSHGTQEGHGEAFARIRVASREANKAVAVLADLSGPKLRVGRFEGGGIELPSGGQVVVTVREVQGAEGLIPSEYPALARDVVVADRILLDDGRFELRVRQVDGTEIVCDVVHGGRLTDRKGMNLPGVRVSAPALTDKDRSDAKFAAALGVDYMALSFVRSAHDVVALKQLLAEQGDGPPVVAKIEKPEALAEIGAILEVADAIMVARGDLGVEMPAEEVPIVQQELIRLATLANRPVIVATQMLESMIHNPRPTRAEVTDVAQAAMAQADAVMLSAETATGSFPHEAVATMDRVLRLVEGYQWKQGHFGRPEHVETGAANHSRLSAALSRATSVLSREVNIRAIVVPTVSGRTARLVAAHRPAAPVLVLSKSERMCRSLALHWGISTELTTAERLRDASELAREKVLALGLADPGQQILLVWDMSPERTGDSPSLSILTV